MFGRERDDEEYIAPVEEYRDDGEYSDEYDGYSGGDCADHSHGAAYDTEEYRDDCSDHDHGQTYEDYNAEQAVYDRASDLRSRFAAVLEPGENIVWLGSANKQANASEKGLPATMRIIWYWWIAATLLVALMSLVTGGILNAVGAVPFGAFGIIFLISGGNVKEWSYAITDRRVITLKKDKAVSDYFGNIRNIQKFASRNNRGYVIYRKAVKSKNEKVTATVNSGIFGIDQPLAVYQILTDAMNCRRQKR